MRRTDMARVVRSLGGGRLLDSPKVRRAFGVPLYRRHLERERAAVAHSHDSAVTKRRRGVRAAPSRPELSVIVPVYNVADYVEEALTSILDQSFHQIEVIVIDDGSTDSSLEVVRAIAATDARVRVVTKENAGLGAARNTGVSLSQAPFITFADSDDVVAPDAYQEMMRTITASGSDVVIGGVQRMDSQRHWTPEWAKKVHRSDLTGITAADFPSILWDVYAWNKIYRRDAWDRLVQQVPEGIRYEDQECSGRLYVGGAKLDVLARTVYSWRVREEGTSITQQKTSLYDLRDRLVVIRRMAELMRQADPVLRREWFTKVFEDDLYWYFLVVLRVEDDRYWGLLQRVVSELLKEAPEESLRAVTLHRRLLALAMARGGREDFEKVLLASQETKSCGQLQIASSGALIQTLPVLDSLSFEVGESLLEVDPGQLSGVVALRQYRHEPDTLVLGGDCIVHGVDNVLLATTMSAWLVPEVDEAGDVEPIELEISQAESLRARVDATDSFNNYAMSGFVLRVPVAETLAKVGSGSGTEAPRRWLFRLEITLPTGHSIQLGISRKDTRGSGGRLTATNFGPDGCRLAPFTSSEGLLGLEVVRPIFVTDDVTIDHNRLTMTIRSRRHPMTRLPKGPWRVVLCREDSNDILPGKVERAQDCFRVVIDLPTSHPRPKTNTVRWALKFGLRGRPLHSVAAISHESWSPANRFVPGLTGYGYLILTQQFQLGEVQYIEITEDQRQISIGGRYWLDPDYVRTQTPTFALVCGGRVHLPRWSRIDAADHTFEVTFDLMRKDADGRECCIETGLYTFQLLASSRQPLPASAWLPVGAELVAEFPADVRGERQRILCTRTPGSGALALDVRPPYREDESGSYQQQLMISQYRSVGATKTPGQLRPAILFESFAGRAIQDSPLALDQVVAQQRPDLERLWTVRDHSIAVPDGATPVLIHSRAWYEALATSTYLVNNNNFPYYFEKQPGQCYLQTWHGSPLKRIGRDVPNGNLSLSYRALMAREAGQYWDYLIAQTPWAGEIFRQAFGYDGVVLDQGYPRNDAIVASARAAERRELIRRHFGIGSGQQVILYAPTWRDNKKDAQGRYLYQTFLDTGAVRAAFGPDAIVLMRGHTNTLASRKNLATNLVREVTAYPDINDLILASDVLVTDYSSVMFDYVVTGKPMIFLVPDLEEYRDDIRGFYFDFENTSPGPLCVTSAEVVTAMETIFSGGRTHENNYREFARTFAGFDDGHASERVLASLGW